MRQILMSGRLPFILFFVFSKKCFAKYKYQVQTKMENGWKNIAQIDLDVTSLRVLTMTGKQTRDKYFAIYGIYKTGPNTYKDI